MKNYEQHKRFIIEDGRLTKYNGAGGDITIPDGVTNIGEHAFEYCRKRNIHAPKGSYAEKYAKDNNIAFVAE